MENIIEKIEFEIEGIAPLLMDRYHGLPDPKTPEGYKKQAEEKCYRNEGGELVIEAKAIKACMRLASSELGKKMEGKKNRQSIRSGIFFEPETFSTAGNQAFSLGKTDHDGIKEDLATRGVGEKVTRVITYRPMIKEWKIRGTMNIMAMPKGFVKQALELGGVRYGLLGYRPEFGRFIVTKFEEVKE